MAWKLRILHQGAVLAIGILAFAATARAGDDTARFYGTWTTSFVVNGQRVTMTSIHNVNGYQNYFVLPTGNTDAGSGSFSAANGIWKSSAPYPNDAGAYFFMGNNTAVCTNAAGQKVVWTRQSTARPGNFNEPQPGPAPGPETAPQPTNSKSQTDDFPPSKNPAVNRGFAAMKQRDYRTAWSEFMTAAKQGDSDGQAALGGMLMNHVNPPGTGFYAQAEQWLLASARQNNDRGMDLLGQFYYQVGRNIAGGINPGHNTAPISAGERMQAEEKFRLSRQWLEKSAAMGNQYAKGDLAILLDAGVGGPADKARAAQLRAEAAAGPDKAFGEKVTADPETQAFSASWQAGHYADALRQATARANQGDAPAQALLCKAYYEGVGAPRNFATALNWCNRAVALNNADGMFILGLMYEHGAGVNQDLDKALNLFNQAAQRGQGFARMEAKGMLMQGEANRTAAEARKHMGVEETACGVAGGSMAGFECIRGGETIDPFDATQH